MGFTGLSKRLRRKPARASLVRCKLGQNNKKRDYLIGPFSVYYHTLVTVSGPTLLLLVVERDHANIRVVYVCAPCFFVFFKCASYRVRSAKSSCAAGAAKNAAIYSCTLTCLALLHPGHPELLSVHGCNAMLHRCWLCFYLFFCRPFDLLLCCCPYLIVRLLHLPFVRPVGRSDRRSVGWSVGLSAVASTGRC